MSTEEALYVSARAEVGDPDSVLLPGHDVPLGRFTTVRRLLPHRQRRMIGAWCFVDHFGPDAVCGRPGMQVRPRASFLSNIGRHASVTCIVTMKRPL
jgi:hypothetical protein